MATTIRKTHYMKVDIAVTKNAKTNSSKFSCCPKDRAENLIKLQEKIYNKKRCINIKMLRDNKYN